MQSRVKQNSPIDFDLENIISRAIKISEIISLQSKTKLVTVAMFDMVGSTLSKRNIGHQEVARKMIVFNEICSIIIRRFKGEMIKYLGDGNLSKFSNPLFACLAAINVLHYAKKSGIDSKLVLCLGVVEEIQINSQEDIIGNAVDRCFRIEKIAKPNLISIDSSLQKSVISFLTNYQCIKISDFENYELKGLGIEEIFEISLIE
ncbi:MAG: hypothetical protein PVH93_08810 [Nitrosopumilaceae archaeon]|jgi:class 3 adenylate cyclase